MNFELRQHLSPYTVSWEVVIDGDGHLALYADDLLYGVVNSHNLDFEKDDNTQRKILARMGKSHDPL